MKIALAVGKHAVHLASDAFTKMGLPIPIVNSLSPELTEIMIKNGIDIYSVSRGIALAQFINLLIANVHGLFYDESIHGERKLYQVKTRKILSYSNTIASVSNVIQAAFRQFVLNDPDALKSLDIGGFIVTLYRLVSDYHFIKQVKFEFLEKEFYNTVMGTEFDF